MTWQWQTDNGHWRCYDDVSQQMLNSAMQSKVKKLKLTIAGTTMKINLKELTQKNSVTKKKRAIQYLACDHHQHTYHCAPIVYVRRYFPTMAYALPSDTGSLTAGIPLAMAAGSPGAAAAGSPSAAATRPSLIPNGAPSSTTTTSSASSIPNPLQSSRPLTDQNNKPQTPPPATAHPPSSIPSTAPSPSARPVIPPPPQASPAKQATNRSPNKQPPPPSSSTLPTTHEGPTAVNHVLSSLRKSGGAGTGYASTPAAPHDQPNNHSTQHHQPLYPEDDFMRSLTMAQTELLAGYRGSAAAAPTEAVL